MARTGQTFALAHPRATWEGQKKYGQLVAVLRGSQPDASVAQIKDLGKLLDRHLTDEEEIIVPAIPRSGFKG